MRKEPQRRYASAAEFSEDLRRHMEALADPRARGPVDLPGRQVYSPQQADGGGSAVGGRKPDWRDRDDYASRPAAPSGDFRMFEGSPTPCCSRSTIRSERCLDHTVKARESIVSTVLQYLEQAGTANRAAILTLQWELATAYQIDRRRARLTPSGLISVKCPAAMESQRKALAMAEQLAAPPRRPEAKRLGGLIDTHITAAGLEGMLGNPAAAGLHYRRALALLAKHSPVAVPRYLLARRCASISASDAVRAWTSAEGELAHYRTALEISQ